MGQACGGARKQEDPLKAAILRKQRRTRLKEFPVMLPHGHVLAHSDGSHAWNSQARAYDELGSELVAGSEAFGSVTNKLVQRLEKFDPPATFHCRCRVTGRDQNWGRASVDLETITQRMSPEKCKEWTIFGDLLVVEAEKVMEEHGINDDLGMVRLARVYDILDGGKRDPIGTEDVDVEPSSEPIDFVRLEKALDAKFFKFTHYKGTGGGF